MKRLFDLLLSLVILAALALPLLLLALAVRLSSPGPALFWSDRVGRRKILALGYAIFALTALGFAAVTSLVGLIALFALYGMVYALVDGSERAFVSDLSAAGMRGSSLGIYYGATGVTAIVSSLVAGALWSWWGAEATFLFGAGAAALAAVGLMWGMNKAEAKAIP